LRKSIEIYQAHLPTAGIRFAIPTGATILNSNGRDFALRLPLSRHNLMDVP
jgi:hypothetical protein